ncbi:MAG: diaminopimelate epimerase [Proteobacteria bacterium]|nr:diaminopimelate epimerase [Pseudomonadota bacterium]MCL2308575.1 diaminopimelate epimerase [Pseudomonadota bacterium]
MSALSSLPFTKMHGLGNDFVVLDGISRPFTLSREAMRLLTHRRYGVGCDQVLLIEPTAKKDVDFRYRIFNSDGSDAGHCGNGARCLAVFAYTHGLTNKRTLRLQIESGVIETRIEDSGEVSVDMGVPRFDPDEIPFIGGTNAIVEPLDLFGESVAITALSMGNPHAVQVVPNVSEAPVDSQGPFIETHVRFPRGVNAGYMQVLDRGHIRIRVWERGVGETMACGTGACAAVVTGIRRELLDRRVEVETNGGFLTIAWPADNASVIMRGPAETTFEGVWQPPA